MTTAVTGGLSVEPRGFEFEEILVVTDSEDPGQSAFRLDDDPPHVRRWAEDE
jgi:hypothetical protein